MFTLQALDAKFAEVLRDNLQVQTQFKAIMQARIKRHMKNFMGDNIDEEELERLARDPKEAEEFRLA